MARGKYHDFLHMEQTSDEWSPTSVSWLIGSFSIHKLLHMKEEKVFRRSSPRYSPYVRSHPLYRSPCQCTSTRHFETKIHTSMTLITVSQRNRFVIIWYRRQLPDIYMTFANARKNTEGTLEFVKLLSHLHCIDHSVLPAFSSKEAKQHADRIVHYMVIIWSCLLSNTNL